jgi:2-hydroxyacyl-CoA lyase 1
LLAGSSETHLVTQGAFQELDAVSLLTPSTKTAIRPPSVEAIPDILENAYRTAFYGRPGTSFVDLPADIIKGTFSSPESLPPVPQQPLFGPPPAQIDTVARLIRSARSPLIVIGKGSAYSQAEESIRALVEATQIPFLPTPMGKGVVSDDHPRNVAAARSTALQHADVVLLLGARLNWILHMGAPPKWNPSATFVQVDIEALEIGRNAGTASFGLIGDIGLVAAQLREALHNWSFAPTSSPYLQALSSAISRNEAKAAEAASKTVPAGQPLTFPRAFDIIKTTLHELSPPSSGGLVYVSEGANTMDISRSVFPVSHPRQRLDAGTSATMGVGLGYAIAAHAAYNPPRTSSSSKKKIVCLEGDSALGFSGLEIETMARSNMDVLIFVMNNGGVYHGEGDSQSTWAERAKEGKLRSTSLGFETKYELLADMCGGMGYCVRTEDELANATREGFESDEVAVVNVLIEAGERRKLEFGWQAAGKAGKGKAKEEAKL